MIHSPKLFSKHVVLSDQAEYQGNESLSPFEKQLPCEGKKRSWLSSTLFTAQTEGDLHSAHSSLTFFGSGPEHQDIPTHHPCESSGVQKKGLDSKGQKQRENDRDYPCDLMHFVGQKWCILVCVAKTSQVLCRKIY